MLDSSFKILKLFPPELAHSISIKALKYYNFNFDSNDDHILIMTYGSLVFDCMKVCDSIFINQEINSRILVPSLLSPIDDELLNLVCNLKPSTIFFFEEDNINFSWSIEFSERMQRNFKFDINRIFRIGMKNNFIHGASTSIEENILLDEKKIKNFILDKI